MPKIITPEQKAEIQRTICLEIAAGRSLKSILDGDPSMPNRDTVYEWLHDDVTFSDNYTRAREAQADYYADEIATIADTEPDPNKARVRIDARKWAAGKLKPKVYGDKLDITGDFNIKLPDEQVESRLAHLLRKAGTLGAVGGEGTAEGPAQVLQHVSRDGASET